MATIQINDNTMDLRQYKGAVEPCKYCRPEETILGRACQWCMSQGYLAACLNCKGTGKVTAGAVWDGGRSQHTSTCHPCSGKGFFPARERDYLAQQQPAPSISSPVEPPPLPKVVRPMRELHINRHTG